MDDSTVQFTQQWAQANGIDSVEVEKVLSNMDMSDYVVFNNAVEKKDYDMISQLYSKAKATIMESYIYFNNDVILENSNDKRLGLIKSMPYNRLYEAYRLLPNSSYDMSQLSIAAMQTLVYEGLGGVQSIPTMKPQKPAGLSQSQTTPQASTMPPASSIDLKQKQTQLQQAPQGQTQVAVQGANNQQTVLDVDQLDLDQQNPENSNIVVKDPNKPNEINIMSINDVELVDDQQGQDPELDRISTLAGI